jgi:HAD superfamily phosphatase (TIGR01668 family)
MYRSIYEINLEELSGEGVAGLILDIDNTLVRPKTGRPDDRVVCLLERARGAGLGVCILSNATRKRVAEFSSGLGVYAICGAGKPAKIGFLKAARLLGLENGRICVAGDQIFTDVAGAKRLGMVSALTERITKREFFTIKLKRVPEYFVIKLFSTIS